jgi:glycosyltransferase involved in cell wall biosynthesis
MIFIVYKSLIQVGGAEKFLYEFFINLKKYHNVKILCKEYNDEVINFFKINKKDILVPKKNNYVDWFNFLLRNINKDQTIIVQSGFKDIFLISLLKRIKTILFLHHPYFNSLDHFDLLSFIHNKKRKNFITTSENYKFYQKLKNKAKKNSNYFKTNLNAILIFLSFKKANKIVVLSEYGRREKNEIFNVDPIYIQPAIGQTFIDHANTISEFKKENQIIYFGRLSKEKRVDILIKAFNSIDIDCKLIIIGDGEELANLKDLASQNKKVIFKGFLKDYELFEEIKKSKLMVTLEWADYNLTVYESIILGTRVLFGKTFEIEKSDQKLIENKMLFYCEPSEYEVAKMIKYIFNLEKPEIESFNFLNSNNWENYVKAFLNEVLEEK